MNTLSTFADCCPKCDPFDFTALLPLTVTGEPDQPESLCAFYRCHRGHEWQCWWDACSAGWPLERRAA